MLIVTIPWGPLIARVPLDTQETEQRVLVKMITLFLDRSSSIYFSYIAQITCWFLSSRNKSQLKTTLVHAQFLP